MMKKDQLNWQLGYAVNENKSNHRAYFEGGLTCLLYCIRMKPN